MKKRLIFERIYLVLLFVVVILWISCFAVGIHALDRNIEHNETVLEPTMRTQDEDGVVNYVFEDVEWTDGKNSILFYANHQEIYAYSDDDLIFTREAADSIFGHSTGSTWNIFNVPTSTKTLTVVLDPVFDVSKNAHETFYIGDGTQLILSKMQSGVVNSIICLLIIVVGFCLIIYWIISKRSKVELRELGYLGIFAMLLGVWSFSETDLSQILIQNRTLGTFIGFSSIGLMGPASVLFAKYYFRCMDKFIHRIFVAYGLLIVITSVLLQMLHVVDMKQVAPAIQMVIPLSFIYWCYGIINMVRQHKSKNRIIVNFVGMTILVVSIAIDLTAYYTARSSANRSGKYGFLIYITILAIETGRSSLMHLEEKRLLETYREMAYKDMLTGCYNRNAFDFDLKEITDPTEVIFIAFDLNNLKHCNDTLGHAKGDEYLMSVAKSIRLNVGKMGKVYRTGGDEFTAIIRKSTVASVEELVRKMKNERHYVTENRDEAYACGMAFFDPNCDQNLNDTLRRADEIMYEDKRQIKEDDAGERTGRIL